MAIGTLGIAPAAAAPPGTPGHDGSPFKDDDPVIDCAKVVHPWCAPNRDPYWQHRVSGGMMSHPRQP